jgi:small conductance mechanosensitive channel
MDLICVSLATPDNKSITMSNKLVWGNPIVNYSNMDKRRVDMTTSVAYGTDISQVKTLLMQMLASYPEVLPNPQPVVEVSKCADSSIDFMVCPWVKPQDYWTVKWRFQSEEYDKLTASGIEIPFNQLDVHIRTDGES